jgi:hypothetical protein
MIDERGFIDAARVGVVVVMFNSSTTATPSRIVCTLNHSLSGGKVPDSFPDPKNSELIPVWCLNTLAWRSFRKDSVASWFVENT